MTNAVYTKQSIIGHKRCILSAQDIILHIWSVHTIYKTIMYLFSSLHKVFFFLFCCTLVLQARQVRSLHQTSARAGAGGVFVVRLHSHMFITVFVMMCTWDASYSATLSMWLHRWEQLNSIELNNYAIVFCRVALLQNLSWITTLLTF